VRPGQPGFERPLFWVGSARRDLLEFPRDVVRELGYLLGLVQHGGTPERAKPWKGLGYGVFELVQDWRGDTFRAVYLMRFREAIYVLHCFQKKSPSGIQRARPDTELIERRLRLAAKEHEVRYGR
jgi:phage-related protein